MKRLYRINNKSRVALLLSVVIVLILLNNLWERKRFSNLEHSIASIYQDRLLPATYLYEICWALLPSQALPTGTFFTPARTDVKQPLIN